MNKKFILVSLSIFVLSFVFILGFKFILGDKVLYEDAVIFAQGQPIIKYVGFEEDENVYKIKISIKNSTDYYASFNNISSTDLAVEVVAFPQEDLARMRGETIDEGGLNSSGGVKERRRCGEVSGLGVEGWMVGPDDLSGLFQP